MVGTVTVRELLTLTLTLTHTHTHTLVLLEQGPSDSRGGHWNQSLTARVTDTFMSHVEEVVRS